MDKRVNMERLASTSAEKIYSELHLWSVIRPYCHLVIPDQAQTSVQMKTI